MIIINNINEINTIYEYTNNNVVYGVYSVLFDGKQKVFIRNGDSIGSVTHWLDEPASKCVNEIRTDVKDEFLEYLKMGKEWSKILE